MTKFHDLDFKKLPDGSIQLTQCDCGEDYIILLHPAQLRHIAEQLELVAPNYPADELSKRLARQLCEIQRELTGECHRSLGLDRIFAKLDGYCSSLPDAIFPHDLWDDDEAQESGASTQSASKATNPTTAPEKMQHNTAIAPQADGGEQLGLNV